MLCTAAVTGALTSWKRVNDAPYPDLGVLDTILGSGEAGSGISWLESQVNATALKEVASACTQMHTQLQTVNVPGISWKPFKSIDTAPSGKHTIVVDSAAKTEHLVSADQWSQIVDAVQHVCSGIDTFATTRAKREAASKVTKQYRARHSPP